MRIVFMGTPEFAVPSLQALLDAGYDVVGVFTQPDRPAGRGNKLVAGPVKKLALEKGIPVYQFEKIRRREGREALEALCPDLCVTAAFGQILSQRILDVPKMGTVNVHASLLPRHRGSAPIVWSIKMGDAVTGVTTMLTDAGLDTGAMLLRRETAIGPTETAGELTERLSIMGAELLIETIRGLEAGAIQPVPQNEDEASYEPMLEKEMARIDWTADCDSIDHLVRAFHPWPTAFTQFEGGTLKIHAVRPVPDMAGEPGEVLLADGKRGLYVACGRGAVEVLTLQAPGGKAMEAKAYLRGKSIPQGGYLGHE